LIGALSPTVAARTQILRSRKFFTLYAQETSRISAQTIRISLKSNSLELFPDPHAVENQDTPLQSGFNDFIFPKPLQFVSGQGWLKDQ